MFAHHYSKLIFLYQWRRFPMCIALPDAAMLKGRRIIIISILDAIFRREKQAISFVPDLLVFNCLSTQILSISSTLKTKWLVAHSVRFGCGEKHLSTYILYAHMKRPWRKLVPHGHTIQYSPHLLWLWSFLVKYVKLVSAFDNFYSSKMVHAQFSLKI